MPQLEPEPEPTAAPGPVGKLRFLSYNVWGLPSPLLTDKTRFADIHARIPAIGADIIGFQETFTKHSKILAQIPGYPYVAWGPKKKFPRFSSGLLLVSKYPITFTTSTTYSVCEGFDCLSRKGVLYARIQVPEIGEVDVFVTHMNAFGADGARVEQTHQMADFVELFHDPARPLILLGDFNSKPGTVENDLLQTRLNVLDAHEVYVSAKPDLTDYEREQFTSDGRINDNASSANEPKRIDYCFYRSDRLRAETTYSGMAFDSKVGTRFLSDHFGVLTDIEFY